MPSAAAEAEAAAMDNAVDVWRLITASRLQYAEGKQKRHCAIKLNANGRLDNLLSAICRSSPHEAGGGTNHSKSCNATAGRLFLYSDGGGDDAE